MADGHAVPCAAQGCQLLGPRGTPGRPPITVISPALPRVIHERGGEGGGPRPLPPSPQTPFPWEGWGGEVDPPSPQREAPHFLDWFCKVPKIAFSQIFSPHQLTKKDDKKHQISSAKHWGRNKIEFQESRTPPGLQGQGKWVVWTSSPAWGVFDHLPSPCTNATPT